MPWDLSILTFGDLASAAAGTAGTAAAHHVADRPFTATSDAESHLQLHDQRLTSAAKMITFENGVQWHPCPSVPQSFVSSRQPEIKLPPPRSIIHTLADPVADPGLLSGTLHVDRSWSLITVYRNVPPGIF